MYRRNPYILSLQFVILQYLIFGLEMQKQGPIFRDIRRYYCEYCGICHSKKSLISSQVLSHHQDKVNEIKADDNEEKEGLKSNTCDACGLSFQKPAHLKQHMRSHSLEDCVMAALEKKTVIPVTHQEEFLSVVDDILVMECGKIFQSGNYKELLLAGTAFEKLVNVHKTALKGLEHSAHGTKSFKQEMGHMNALKESSSDYLSKGNSETEITMESLPALVVLV